MKRTTLFRIRKNHSLVVVHAILILMFVFAMAPGTAFSKMSKQVLAQKEKAANDDLDVLAQEIAKLCTQPGFRGFLRSEIAKSKNRENIVELDKFLSKAQKQKNMPPGLAKVRDTAQKAKGRLKASGLWRGQDYDLYIPVDAHRKKWRGGKDFVVAYDPVTDEKDVKQIVAYRVTDGTRVMLDPNKAPGTVVLIVAPCEHKTHVVQPLQVKKGPVPPENPKPNFKGKDPPAPKGMKEPGGGNSLVGLHYVKIFDDHEPWYKGAPEIDIQFFQRKGNVCVRKTSWCDRIDNEGTWYNTWDYTYYANPAIKHYFDSNYWNLLYVFINERDANGYYDPYLVQLYPGITCEVYRWSNDDWVDYCYQWRYNFAYDMDYYQNIGNAYLVWRKTH
ncbi:MAG: DUF3103 family protein [Deltaproteobacteria bacterium]|nr:DUF3103 family protein [Deltaproteobacteria bacterium]